MNKRLSTTAVLCAAMIGVLAAAVPVPTLADAPQQGNGKCWADGENPCGPCEEWKRNCRKFVCIPIPGCVPDTPGEPVPGS